MKSRFKTPVVGSPPVLTAAQKLIKTRDAVERDLTAWLCKLIDSSGIATAHDPLPEGIELRKAKTRLPSKSK